MSPWRLFERLVGPRWARYSAVSGASIFTTQVVLVGLAVAGFPPARSNAIAVTIGAIPSYILNRRWTWDLSDGHRVAREVLPFVIVNIIGFVWSTALVAWAATRWDHVAVANVGNLAAFAVMWVGKFFLFDKLLFSRTHEPGTVTD